MATMEGLINAFTTLMVTTDPPGLAPIFLALTAGMNAAERRQTAIRGKSVDRDRPCDGEFSTVRCESGRGIPQKIIKRDAVTWRRVELACRPLIENDRICRHWRIRR